MNCRSLYQTGKGPQGFAAAERESSVSRSIGRRLRLWRRGFVSESDAVYDLEEYLVCKRHDVCYSSHWKSVHT
ncbi:hypothetical protein GS429_19000 [Natronorubrum sp. JWXQ-INN-674]|uniref:Uncharacterized protein n=1 Tax=Natronorubrum halalkaliphilum TaxID=2691917 RepID=A0A6B0VRP9_9EURY|nr:hypothetical protein [Natronorubrum halalkaliphilum]MXV64114.1 hypothetical protein [Natronorubrum halalkaliphilum]